MKIEISRDTYKLLLLFMNESKAKTVDQAIQQLLNNYNEDEELELLR